MMLTPAEVKRLSLEAVELVVLRSERRGFEAENKRLREALALFADCDSWAVREKTCFERCAIARAALERVWPIIRESSDGSDQSTEVGPSTRGEG